MILIITATPAMHPITIPAMAPALNAADADDEDQDEDEDEDEDEQPV